MSDAGWRVFHARRQLSEEKLRVFDRELAACGRTEDTAVDFCVYATGSLGRLEGSSQSDLDVFILDLGPTDRPSLSNMAHARLKVDLDDARLRTGFPEFTGDGEYLDAHSLTEMLEVLGSREDDAKNVFTARILLLLESRCVLGNIGYSRAIKDIVDSYWRDYAQNATEFLPILLANDIVRYWKTLCLNYEAKRNLERNETDPVIIGKRRLDNLKLKFSRLWTCVSGLCYLAHQSEAGTVEPSTAMHMAELRPVERMLAIASARTDVADAIGRALTSYEWFLEFTDRPKDELYNALNDPAERAAAKGRATAFGDTLHEVLQNLASVGPEPILRYLLI